MTIDEAIEKSKELASTYRIAAKNAENIFISKLMQETKRKIYIKLAEEHEQLAEWLEELKALRLLLDWAIECNFGLDSFPEEYEKYKHTLTDDMTYKDMIIQIAKCVVAEEIKEQK